MKSLNPKVLSFCKDRLLQAKVELLNRARENRREYQNREKFGGGGDEGDRTMEVLAENKFLTFQERLRVQVLEIETALAKIEKGIYGICEETQEPIETDRLKALPWTRLSIEGAEIREELTKRFAR